MSVKIKISYERPEELIRVLDILQHNIRYCKVPKSQDGRFRKAYVYLKDAETRENPII